MVATSVLKEEPDSRPEECFAKSETGRSHASSGPEGRCVSDMSAAAEYSLKKVTINPLEQIELATLAVIKPS
jgi:hypothetical protein